MLLTNKLTRIIIFLFALCAGLYFAKTFLVPVCLSAMIAMMLTPLCVWLQKKGAGRGLAASLSLLLFIAAVSLVMGLLSWQVSGLFNDAGYVVAEINKAAGRVQEFIATTFGVQAAQQQQMFKEQALNMSSGLGGKVSLVAGSLAAILGKSLLAIVYVFLFIYYRGHLRDALIRFMPSAGKEQVEKVIDSSSHVAQQYVSGLGKMIVVLWIMYGIGFSIVGVKHALFFAVLCGLLEIVPYVGNLTGCSITAIMAFTQGGGSMALWILLVYAIVQVTQTYILEPLVVGAKVNINPLFTILVIIVGEILWGVPGMVLAIPILGIVKIVCDNVPALQPFGFLIGVVKVKKSRAASHKRD